MSSVGHWFEVREAERSDPTGDSPRVSDQPAHRVLIPAPTRGMPRTVATGWDAIEPARGVIAVGPVAERTGSLADLGLCEGEAGRGSVAFALAGLAAGNEEMPWPGRERASSGGDGSRGWSLPADGIPLSRRLAAVLQPSTDLLLAGAGPMEWPRPLLPYQLVGVRELVARESLLLADDMGLGKTLQTLAALRVLIRRREIESALVVVPAGLISQWRAELRRWAPELRVSTVHGAPSDRAWQWRTPAHIYLTSYETLRVDYTDNPHSPLARLWDVVVLDEAQRIKNAATDVSRVCKRLRRKRQWAVTGTPLENSPEDLISILEFVDPTGSDELRRFMLSVGLRDHLRRVQLRRRKADVLHDLPRKLVSSVVLPLTPRQRESYERAERSGVRELRELGDRLQPENVLNLIGRLRGICNFCPVTGESSKLNDLRDRLQRLAEEGHKALVFTQFANASYGARAIAARLGPAALVYTGDQAQGARDRVLDEFRTNPDRRALVLSLLAGGQGLNLQEASYVFHFDRWWNPAVVGQAEARSHRLGQRHPVNVYAYTAENTIEERLERILREKQLLFNALVDDVSIDVSPALSRDQLCTLFGLAAPVAPQRAARDVSPLPDLDRPDSATLSRRVRETLERRGWQVRVVGTVDGGVSLTATRLDEAGFESALSVRCLSGGTPATVDQIRGLAVALRTAAGGDGQGLVVCPFGFTEEARTFAADREIALWDRRRLGELSLLPPRGETTDLG